MGCKMSDDIEWARINDFKGILEFERFVAWIDDLIKSGGAIEHHVDHPYAGSTSLKERWITKAGRQQMWRIVWPDGPFKGVFEPVAMTDS